MGKINVNQVRLVGHLGRDPEIRFTAGGRQVANFTVATGNSYKDKATGQLVEKPASWHNIVVYGENGYIQNATKGQYVEVNGKIQYRDWTDKEGNRRTITEILAFEVKDGPGGEKREAYASRDDRPMPGEKAPSLPGFTSTPQDDDVPF